MTITAQFLRAEIQHCIVDFKYYVMFTGCSATDFKYLL